MIPRTLPKNSTWYHSSPAPRRDPRDRKNSRVLTCQWRAKLHPTHRPPKSGSVSSTRTIIEASYVVEQLEQEIIPPLHSPTANPPTRISESISANQEGLPRPASGDARDRALESLTAAAAPNSNTSHSGSPQLTGRKVRVASDELDDFVAERLSYRDAPLRLWLKILWGVAAVAILAALAGLGYAIRSQLLLERDAPKSSFRFQLRPERFGVRILAFQRRPSGSEMVYVPGRIGRNF
jgi:hypothetical protein